MKNIRLNQKDNDEEYLSKETVLTISKELMFAKHGEIKDAWENLRIEILKFYEEEYIPIVLKNIDLKIQYDKLTLALKMKNIIDDSEINQNNVLFKKKLDDLYSNAIKTISANKI